VSDDLVIRRFQEGDEEKVNVLLTTVFGGRTATEYWRWKYKENPAGFYGNIQLAEEKGIITAWWGIIPVMLKVNDEIVRGAQAVDAATHPDYRRQGLFETLCRMTFAGAVADGIHLTYSFPGRMSYGAHMKMGWHDLGIVPRRYRVLKAGDALKPKADSHLLINAKPRNLRDTASIALKSLRKQALTAEEASQLRSIRHGLLLLAVLLSNLRFLFRPDQVKRIPGLVIKEVDSFDERITPFWREISRHFPIAVDRNSEYLNWRYRRNPVSKYVIFIAENGGQIEGYMVLKSEREEGIIMDIISRENRVFVCLLDRALRYFINKDKAVVQCWMPDSFAYCKILRKFGFGSYYWLAKWASRLRFLKGLINPFILYINSPDVEKRQRKLKQLDSWFLAAGDSDWEDFSTGW